MPESELRLTAGDTPKIIFEPVEYSDTRSEYGGYDGISGNLRPHHCESDVLKSTGAT